MKLAELTAQPKLIPLSIDDEDTVAKYGEPVEFWVYDRQPMENFMAMATIDKENFGSIAGVLGKIVLDEKGAPILNDKNILPMDIMIKVITKVVDSLGNSVSQTLKT